MKFDGYRLATSGRRGWNVFSIPDGHDYARSWRPEDDGGGIGRSPPMIVFGGDDESAGRRR